MKKSLLALAVLGAFAGTAAAQVTVYGIVDAGYGTRTTEVDGVDTVKSRGAQNAILGASRWGIRGSEDLGNGLKAIFQLESNVGTINGTTVNTNDTSKRSTFVGLEGGFGRVTLGRDMNPFHNIAAAYDIDGRNTFSTTGQADLYTGTFRSNALTYTSPNFGGITVRGQVSSEKADPNGTAATFKDNQFALAASYVNGPLSVGAALENLDRESPVGIETVDTQSYIIGASYDFKVAKVFANFIQAEDIADDKNREYNLGVTAPVGAFTLVAGVGRNEYRPAVGAKETGTDYNIGANYNLSKRTFVYARVARFDTFEVDGLDNSTTGTQIGIRHSF